MKFFEWASFLLASVLSGGDVPSSVDSAAILSAPEIVAEKKINISSEEKSVTPVSKISDVMKVLKEDKVPQEKYLLQSDAQMNEEAVYIPTSLEPGVTIHLPENSPLIAEEQTQIRVGDKFAAVVRDSVSGEIFSQSEWIEVKK
jgi:hypothetical protein